MPPLTKWRVHLTLREFLPNFTMFLRAFEFLNHMMLPSRLTNIIPVPGSISSPEKLQILLSGIMITLRSTFLLRDLCHVASICHLLYWAKDVPCDNSTNVSWVRCIVYSDFNLGSFAGHTGSTTISTTSAGHPPNSSLIKSTPNYVQAFRPLISSTTSWYFS